MTSELQYQLFQEAIRLFKTGDLVQAIQFMEKSVSLDSSNEDFLEALGVMYARADRLDDAIDVMKKLVRINSERIMAHTNLSQFYAQKGMIDEAEAEQAEARRLSWKAELRTKQISENDINQLLAGEDEQNQRALQEKIERFKQVIALDPNDVLGYFSLGSAYLQAKRFLNAEEILRKAIIVGSDHSPSYVVLGEALEAVGRKKEALEIYEKGIPVAYKKGDMVPLRKMESRSNKIKKELGEKG